MYTELFDSYFPCYVKNHNLDNWNYWKKGYELDRYEIYKIGKESFKMIIPLKVDSFRIYFNRVDDLIGHLDYIKKKN